MHRQVPHEYPTVTVLQQINLTLLEIIHPEYQGRQERQVPRSDQAIGILILHQHMLPSYEIQVARHQGAEQIILTHPVVRMGQVLH